jgi:hypothetical protein
MDRSGIHGHRQGMGIEEHLGWGVEVVKHQPKPRGEWVRLPAEPKRFRVALTLGAG